MKYASKKEIYSDNNEAELQAENLALKDFILQTSLKHNKLINEKNFELEAKYLSIESYSKEIKNKDFEIAYYKKLLFGLKSEKAKNLSISEKQLSLFDEIEMYDGQDEATAEQKLSDDIKAIITERDRLKSLENKYKKNNPDKKKRGRRSFSESNPHIIVEENELDISDEEKQCSCGSCLTRIGEETSETIEYIPASIKIVKNIRFKYSCKSCEENIKIAKKRDKIFAKSAANSSILSHIFISKFEDHLPFYRQAEIFKRYDINLNDKLMSNWFFKSAKLLSPLLMLLKDELINSPYIAIDETTVTTLDKSASNQSYMWVYQSKYKKQKLLYYDFCLNRSSKNPQLIIPSDYKGYIQTDGYSGYNFLNKNDKVIRLGCMAHARRKFFDIAKLIKISKNDASRKDLIAHKVVNKIDEIYLIEKKIKIEQVTDAKEIDALRQKEAKPLLDNLYNYIKGKEAITLAGSPIHKALTYFLNQYQYLKNYLENPMLDIDNNQTENAIRPFALGRKNWMFVGDEQGGAAAGAIYSLIQSAKLNNMHTEKYLQYLLDNIKKDTKNEELKNLLPHLIDVNLIC